MSLDDATRDGLADDLYAALRDAEPIDPLTADHDLSVAEAYDLDPRAVLIELGELGVVGGQEDMITDVAAKLAEGDGAAAEADD